MHGDFTRNTFDPTKHYSSVLMQQGRVALDADWNEQTSILLYYLRTLACDVFGPHAGPADHLGFEIIGNLTDPALETRLKALIPRDADRRKAVKDAIIDGDVLIAPGRYYVDGLLVENHSPILYSEQRGYPFSDDTKREALKNFPNGLLLYLDVWEQHVTFLQDDHIREVALGGPDTCSRAQVVWQLKVLRQRDDAAVFNCDAVSDLPATGSGTMRARVAPEKPSSDLCVISPESHYRGAENQLYRVEVHRGGKATGDAKAATFKWSRDNGSLVFPIKSLHDNKARLLNLGRDRRSTLNSGDWAEILDEAIAARGGPGMLAQVEAPPDRDNLTVTLKVPGNATLPDYDDKDKHLRPMLRRWDHRGDLGEFGGALAITAKPDSAEGPDGWIDLEDSVQVWFSQNEEYRSGDYWLVPARTVTGNVEWPDEPGKKGVAAALPPQGPRHHYAPILLSLPPSSGPASGRRNQDCRCRIERLPCAGYRYGFGGQGIGPNF
jgi:Family of unknown function (DUF6519)